MDPMGAVLSSLSGNASSSFWPLVCIKGIAPMVLAAKPQVVHNVHQVQILGHALHYLTSCLQDIQILLDLHGQDNILHLLDNALLHHSMIAGFPLIHLLYNSCADVNMFLVCPSVLAVNFWMVVMSPPLLTTGALTSWLQR